jgi:hypothetical protein
MARVLQARKIVRLIFGFSRSIRPLAQPLEIFGYEF